MCKKTVLFGLFIFSLICTSCEPEPLPENVNLDSKIETVGDSGSEEAPIDDEKED